MNSFLYCIPVRDNLCTFFDNKINNNNNNKSVSLIISLYFINIKTIDKLIDKN
jgi:hypothetical protein